MLAHIDFFLLLPTLFLSIVYFRISTLPFVNDFFCTLHCPLFFSVCAIRFVRRLCCLCMHNFATYLYSQPQVSVMMSTSSSRQNEGDFLSSPIEIHWRAWPSCSAGFHANIYWYTCMFVSSLCYPRSSSSCHFRPPMAHGKPFLTNTTEFSQLAKPVASERPLCTVSGD